MRFRPGPLLVALHPLALANLLLLFGTLPLGLRAAGALLLAVLLPGVLLALCLGGEPETGVGWLESGLRGLAAGFGLAIVCLLLLAALPGGVERWQMLGAFNLLALALAVVLSLLPRRVQEDGAALGRSFWIALVAVLAIGGLLRLSHLGYSEFQGDEARVLLRAGDVLQGFENALYVHQKAPGEILITAAVYGLAGNSSEAVARLPFALAGLGGLAALLLLGWRMFGPLGGLTAALLLAVDGYLVAFARIVQYQSVVILCTIVVVALLYAMVQQTERLTARLALAAFIAAGGLLAHYDMLGIALPALLLLWTIGRRAGGRRLAVALLPALIVGGTPAALFYLPYLRHPGFATTWAYVVNERVGTTFPYNNLLDVVQRTLLYSSIYYLAFLALATLLLLATLYGRWLGGAGGVLVALATAALTAAALLRPGWLTVAGRDLSGVVGAVPLLLAWMLPRLTLGERAAWFWFAPLYAGALFFIELPDTHVYVFFVPWALVVASGVQRLGEWLAARPAALRRGVAAAGAALAILCATWPWLLFADAPAERLRNWESAQPRGFPYPFDQPPERAIMGFPLRNGWPVVGTLYAEEALVDGFAANARPEVADWYTRGAGACPAETHHFFLTTTVEPTDDARLEQVRQEVEQEHAQTGTVLVGGAERLAIYTLGAPDGPPARHALEESIAAFRALTAEPMRSRRGRVVDAQFATPRAITFGGTGVSAGALLRLRGDTLEQAHVTPGGAITVTLVWEPLKPTPYSYTVFLHIVDPATNGKAGQRDTIPVCGQNPTPQWNPGDTIVDPHVVPIAADAAPGLYRIYAGLYNVETGERLPVLGPDGRPAADFVDLGEVEVGPS